MHPQRVQNGTGVCFSVFAYGLAYCGSWFSLEKSTADHILLNPHPAPQGDEAVPGAGPQRAV